MKFNQRRRLDTSRVNDRRRVGGPAAAGVGVGGLGIIGVIIMLLLSGGDPAALGDAIGTGQGAGTSAPQATGSDLSAGCRTGADATSRQDCRIVAVVNSLDEYWSTISPQIGVDFAYPRTNFFEGRVSTGGCGNASTSVGPFYCPADQSIYIDLSFFSELEQRFGASGGDTAEAYVMAHEYGHHIQNRAGISDAVRQRGIGEGSDAVNLELQADCFAGVWVGNAVSTQLITALSEGDIDEALSAATAVGDDHIQQQSGMQVNPETWTHGSSAERRSWFMTGYNTGDPSACDTFS